MSPINPYFDFVSQTTEQDLVQDLIEEAIQIFGHEVLYIPRDVVNLDTILGEDDLQLFTTSYPIEMYIKNSSSFAGQSEFVSKFGLHIEDQVTFSVSERRFHTEIPTLIRAREGDLIWIQMAPESRYLFEIRFVENQEELFQLGKLYTYELRCERMNFSHERVHTSNTIANDAAARDAYAIEVMLGVGGSGTYLAGETVYQGATLADAYATGRVFSHTLTAYLLVLQDITGTFANAAPIIGVTSHANWTPDATPLTAPTVHDPISDNADLEVESPEFVISRGTNPRHQ